MKKPVSHKISRMLKGHRLLVLFAGLLVFSACSTLDPSRINYNRDKQVYEYPLPAVQPIVLRNDSGMLVTNDNYTEFIKQMSQRGFRYPFESRIEVANTIRASDLEIARLYSRAVENIRNEHYRGTLEAASALRDAYPPSRMFTDISFLEGYAHEKTGERKRAEEKYDEYLKFSSQKYSERFRGYRYADRNGEGWIDQRMYAKSFLAGNTVAAADRFFQPVIPKYYHVPLQPGFTLTGDGLAEHRRGILSVSVGLDLLSDLAVGAQYYRNLGKGLDINPVFYISRNIREFNLALPIQLIKTENDRFGLKLSPFASYMYIKKYESVYPDKSLERSVFNYGAKASSSFFIVQKLSLGSYYTWHYYNENNPLILSDESVEVRWRNEYDISLYYNLIKGLSLKTGIKSGDWVAGLYLTGWEVSYNFNENSIIVRTDLF